MNENNVSDISAYSLELRELYEDMRRDYPNVRISEQEFRALIQRALDKHYRDDADSVPAILLLAGLLRLYQGNAPTSDHG